MAMANTQSDSSPCYPPRARWYSPLFYWTDGFSRLLALDRLQLTQEINVGAMAAGFLAPGLAVYFRTPGLLGKAALSLAGLLLLTFIIWLGYGIGNLAFGMLLSLHVSGFVYYCTPLFRDSLGRRLGLTLLTLAALSLFIYLPARNIVQGYLLSPLQVNGHVVVVRHIVSTKSIQTGDWIAYNISTDHSYEEGGVYVFSAVGFHPGIAFGPVLALPGERIEFFADTFSVNGVPHPRLPHMPVTGSYLVPEKEWFIWPNLAIVEREDVAEASVSSVLLHMALVTEEQLIGRPFQRWFWRRQILS
jgi:hypothetical protein